MKSLALSSRWSRRRLRFDASLNPVKSELTLADETEVSFVPMDAVGELGGLRLNEQRPIDEIYNGYTYFRDGDIVVAKITPCFENGKGALAAGLKNKVGFGTTELHVIRPSETLSPKFLFYLTIASDFRSFGASEMLGAGGQKRVPERFLKDWRPPLPTLETQHRITAFLDEKTTQLDALIEKKRALLDRLAERRQAIITQAVTKGLDPAAAMRDSDIDWLGPIPAHWEVKRLKYVSPRVTVGIVVTPAAYYADEGTLALRGLNVRTMDFDLSDTRNITADGHELNRKSELREGDLVAVRTGAPGTTAIVTADLAGSNCIDLVIIRKPIAANSRFIGWFLNSDAAKTQYTLGSEGALQQHFNVETSKAVIVTLPPVREQREIAAYIDGAILAHDKQSGMVEANINKLQEYRAALITSAVTGQIEGLR